MHIIPSRRVTRARVLALAGALGCAVGARGTARADGAFPSSQAVMLPRDRPQSIVLATTFGLVFSDDDGQTWAYSCETPSTQNGYRYRLGASPNSRIHAVSDRGLPVSNDGACTWTLAGGVLVGARAFDVFPDMGDPNVVFALAYPAGAPDDAPAAPFRSNDGGRTYVGPIYSLPPLSATTGIESAASAPGVVYMTWTETDDSHPRLSVSDDSGTTWSTLHLDESLGSVTPYLVAVDPSDPHRVFLRIIGGSQPAEKFEALVVSPDGGGTWSTALTLPGGTLTGFGLQDDGTLWALATLNRVSHLYQSADGGRTFSDTPLPFTAAGLAERAGTLYIPTQGGTGSDGNVALVSSDDGGQTWRPRLDFHSIVGVRACVASTCHADCNNLASANLFPVSICGGDPAGSPPTRSRTGATAGGCAVTPAHSATDTWAWTLVVVAVAYLTSLTSRRDRD